MEQYGECSIIWYCGFGGGGALGREKTFWIEHERMFENSSLIYELKIKQLELNDTSEIGKLSKESCIGRKVIQDKSGHVYAIMIWF